MTETFTHVSPSIERTIIPFRVFRGISRKTHWPVQNERFIRCQSTLVGFAMSVSTGKKCRVSHHAYVSELWTLSVILRWPRVFLHCFLIKIPNAFFLNPSASVSSSSGDDLRPRGHTIEQIKKRKKVKTQQTRSECCGSWRQALDPNRRRGSGPVFRMVEEREREER